MNEDFLALLSELLDADAHFMVVGAYALGVHVRPRATKDLDIWVEPSAVNAPRVMTALERFGAPLGDLTAKDLEAPGAVFMMGAPPRRIDILTKVDGLTFDQAWPNHITNDFGNGRPCPVIGFEDIITNKKAANRGQDRVDVEILQKARGRSRR